MGGGASISSNSKYLYVNDQDTIWQFNLDTINISSSKITVAQYDGYINQSPTEFMLSSLMNDGKIYLHPVAQSSYLHVINFPDSGGLACTVQQHSIVLPTFITRTIPNYPNYRLGPLVGSDCDTLAVQEFTVRSFHLNIFPNPVAEKQITFTYELPLGKSGVIEIYNTNAQLVATYHLPQWSTRHTEQLPKLANGEYGAVLKSGRSYITKKFIVQ